VNSGTISVLKLMAIGRYLLYVVLRHRPPSISRDAAKARGIALGYGFKVCGQGD
jgi:hypothetical protein